MSVIEKAHHNYRANKEKLQRLYDDIQREYIENETNENNRLIQTQYDFASSSSSSYGKWNPETSSQEKSTITQEEVEERSSDEIEIIQHTNEDIKCIIITDEEDKTGHDSIMTDQNRIDELEGDVSGDVSSQDNNKTTTTTSTLDEMINEMNNKEESSDEEFSRIIFNIYRFVNRKGDRCYTKKRYNELSRALKYYRDSRIH